MFNLIAKEFFLQKKFIKTAVLYCLLIFAMSGIFLAGRMHLNSSPVTLASIYLVHFMLSASCTLDEKQNMDFFLTCLPLNRWEIVAGKFIFLLLPGLVTIIALSVLSMVISANMPNLGFPPPTPAEAIASLTGIFVILAIYLPFHFRSGYFGSRFVGLFAFALAFGVATGIRSALQDFSFGVLAIVSALCVLLFAGSLGLSTLFFSKREF